MQHPASLLGIPTELRIYIAECLAGKSLKAFRATCKDLQNIADLASKGKAKLATDSVLLWFRGGQSQPRHFTQRELLDELKITVDSTSLKEYNALLSACRAGDLDDVRDLLKTVSLIPPELTWSKRMCPPISWYTPVDQAVHSDSIETLELLLAAGADLAKLNLYDTFRLLFGRKSWNRAMADKLIENGLDIRQADGLGDTLLHVLCRGGFGIPTPCTRSPLPEVKYIVDKGVNVEKRNNWGSSPLAIAIERSEYGASAELFDLIRFLLEAGSGVNAACTDQDDYTALHVACEVKSQDIVHLLLDEFHADVDARSFSGETPLHIALEKNSVDICEILLHKGASLTTTVYRHGGRMNYLEYALDMGLLMRSFYDAWVEHFGYDRPDLLLVAAAAIGDVNELERLLPLYQAGPGNAEYNVNVAFSKAVRYQREGAIEFLHPHVSSITAVNKKIARQSALEFADRLSDRTLRKIMARAPSSEIDAYVDDVRQDKHFIGNVLIAMLLSGRAPTSIIMPNCQALLEEAVACHNMEAFRILLQHVQPSDFDAGTIIRGALYYEFLGAVELLQDNNLGPVAISDESNNSMLSDAVRCSKVKALKFLIKAGADPTTAINCSHTRQFDEGHEMQPFAVAISIGHLYEIMQMLLAAKVDPNTKDTQYQLPLLSWASFYGDPHIVRILISHGADVNRVDIFGRTALFYGATCGNPAIIRMLLGAGARLDVADMNQMTALSFAAGAHTDTRSYLPGPDVRDPIRGLCARHGSSSRMSAPYVESAQLLLDAGANVHHKDSSGRSPLSHAAQIGSSELVQKFIDLGVDVDAVDDQGRTALCWACICRKHTAMALVAAGCDVSKADQSGMTPLQYLDYDKVDHSDAMVRCLFG